MNVAYIGKLMELVDQDSRVIHLLADSGTGYDELFRNRFPEHIFNFGIGEENMVAAAAGLSTVGKIPFVYTSGAFLAYRSLEFIRDDVCFQNLNVKIVGMGSGISWSSLGPTHHTTEDISVLRAMPNLMILSASTPNQVKTCVQMAYEHWGPVYIRLEMNKEKEFFHEKNILNSLQNNLVLDYSKFSKEKQSRKKEGIVVYSTGSILEEAYKACDRLGKEGICIKLVDISLIKPFCANLILEDLKYFDKIVVVEEHNIHGGLASIIAEIITYNGAKGRILPLGINDGFAMGYGNIKSVRSANGLDAEHLYARMREFL